MNLDEKVYKRIMMLLILSGSYKISLYEFFNEIDPETNEDNMQQIEELSYEDYLRLFYHENDFVNNYIVDYLEYSNNSYLFKNACLEIALKQNKMDALLKINPFESLAIMDFIATDDLLVSERIIQSVTSIFDRAEYNLALSSEEFEEEEFEEIDYNLLRKKMHELMIKHYKEPTKLISVYRYILANVYEQYKLKQKYNYCSKEITEFIQFLEENP